MDWSRWFRHLFATRADVDRAFPPKVLAAIEACVAEAEQRHSGEIRVAIEAGIHPVAVARDLTARQHALRAFSDLGVWDTEANNGVLIYVLLADRAVEIVADRGYRGRVPAEQWADVCRAMEASFRAGRMEQGVLEGIRRVGDIIAREFPVAPGTRNPDELPNRPTLL